MRCRLTARNFFRAAALMACLAAPTAWATDCLMRCTDDKVCSLRQPTSPALSFRSYVRITECETRVVSAGEVEVRYRRDGKHFTPPAAVTKDFAPVFEKFKPDACDMASNCLQAAMNAVVPRPGGHGADSAESKPGGEGEPCARGLPCGRVVPPPSRWSVQLADRAFNGSWQVSPARNVQGAPSARLTAAVSAGRIDPDGAWFRPGAQYSYVLLDSRGAVVARGEFSTLSQTMADSLRARIDTQVREGKPEAVARFDALARNGLDWDAQQLIVQGSN